MPSQICKYFLVGLNQVHVLKEVSKQQLFKTKRQVVENECFRPRKSLNIQKFVSQNLKLVLKDECRIFSHDSKLLHRLRILKDWSCETTLPADCNLDRFASMKEQSMQFTV